MYLNKVIIIGNLTRDPELKALPSGTQVTNIGVATNRTWKDKEGNKQDAVEFHNVVAFGRTAEIINQYLKKGSSVLIEGRLQTQSWEDKETGQRFKGQLTEKKDIQTSRGAGTTGYLPEHYKQYGEEMYQETLKAYKSFDPSIVYFSEWDL